MSNNISGESGKGYVRWWDNRRLCKRKLTEAAYLAGKNLGYNLGYSQGFESGYDRGYAEGSNLGYNNGFMAALKVEGADDLQPEKQVLENLIELVNCGRVGILLTGPSAKEAEALFKALHIEVSLVNSF